MPGPTITVRLRSSAEVDAIQVAADAAGETRTQWCRRVLLESAGAPTDEPETAARGRRMRRGEPRPWPTQETDAKQAPADHHDGRATGAEVEP